MRYHNITKVDLLNGEGIRVVLWTSGCEHKCLDCQNPITWDPTGGIEFTLKTQAELFQAMKKDYIAGITISGGDPLHPDNRNAIVHLIKDIREYFGNTKTIWLYTGYNYEEIAYLVQDCDVVVDGPYIKELADTQYHWAGSTNQRVIDIKKTVESRKVVLYADY